MLYNFKVDDVVVFRSGSYSKQTLARITQVWKNGVVQIRALDPNDHVGTGRTFDAHGWERGGEGYRRASVIPLPKGTTVKQFLAKQKTTAEKEKAERDAKAFERKLAIDTWWLEVGGPMWNSAQTVDILDGEVVRAIRYTERGEYRLAFVLVTHGKTWDGKPEVAIKVSGFTARKYRDDEKTSFSAFSSSTSSAPTLPEALYQLMH